MEHENVRHDTRHTDQAIHTPETDTDTPETCGCDDALAQLLVARLEGKNGAVSYGGAFVNTWTVSP